MENGHCFMIATEAVNNHIVTTLSSLLCQNKLSRSVKGLSKVSDNLPIWRSGQGINKNANRVSKWSKTLWIFGFRACHTPLYPWQRLRNRDAVQQLGRQLPEGHRHPAKVPCCKRCFKSPFLLLKIPDSLRLFLRFALRYCILLRSG